MKNRNGLVTPGLIGLIFWQAAGAFRPNSGFEYMRYFDLVNFLIQAIQHMK